MKIINIIVKNIGALADVNLPVNRPLMLFYGDIKQGKSTLLNAVRYAFGGAFPADIIKHGELEAIVKLETDEGAITREFYRAEDGTNKARPLTVVRNGAKVPKPVEWLKKFVNPFLLDGDYLVNMTPDERKKYFVSLFGAGTEALDKESNDCEAEARELRARVKSYGSLDLTPVKRVDVDSLRARLDDVRDHNASELLEVRVAKSEQEAHNASVIARSRLLDEQKIRLNHLESQIKEVRAIVAASVKWLEDNPTKAQVFEAELVDTKDLEDAVAAASGVNVRAEIYVENQKKHQQRVANEDAIKFLEARQREIAGEKVARLVKINDACGIPGLEFIPGGSFNFEGTSADMLSTSQLMNLSSALSALYPDGVGLDLIDRAESLGSSIFDFVERAKAGNKTILAAIVGERPANVPAEVGVFVVKEGTVS